jgi:hypothetical protein
MDAPIPDPFRACRTACNHDLSRGVLVSDLLSGDGPHSASMLLVSLSPTRQTLFDEEHREVAGQQSLLVDEAV